MNDFFYKINIYKKKKTKKKNNWSRDFKNRRSRWKKRMKRFKYGKKNIRIKMNKYKIFSLIIQIRNNKLNK